MGRFTATVHHYLNNLVKIFLVIAALRAVLLILKLPIIPIPYLDPFLFMAWDLCRAIIELISGSSLIPRMI